MQILIVKILIAPILIYFATWAGRRYGPTISGLLVGLPLTSGPIALILALENGNDFAAISSKGILLGLISVGVFSITYAWTARHYHWIISLILSWTAFLIVTYFLRLIDLQLLQTYLLVIVSLFLILYIFPKFKEQQRKLTTPKWDIPVRMIVATVFIVGITYFSKNLGAKLSGLLAPFPIYGSIFAASTHYLYGSNATTKLLRGVIIGSFSFATFFLVVGQFTTSIGIGWIFIMATFTALALQGIYILLFHNRAVKS